MNKSDKFGGPFKCEIYFPQIFKISVNKEQILI